MDPRDYGIDQYGDNLFTTQEELRDHPDRVARVIRAVIKGWEYAFEHPDELIDLILSKYAPGKTREHLEFEAKMTEMLVLPDLVPIGVISASRYARIAGNFAQLGFVENEGIPEGFIYVPPVSARSGLDLSYQEEAWLDEHAIVSLLVSSDLVPYAYMEDGEFVGVLADICARLESLLGITFVYAPIDREGMKQQIVGSDQLVVAGLDPWDVSSLVLYERTQEIVAMPFALFAINENDVHDEGFQDRAHVRIAIRQDWDLAHPALQALQPCEFVLGASVLECINMVLRGEADAVFDIASVITGLLSQHLIHNIRMVEVFNQGQPLVIHIRKDWPELRSALDKALDVIAPAERISLLESWNAYSEDPSFRLVAVSLTEEERKWLLEHPVIRVGSDPAWAPIEFRDDQGRYQGVAVDYLHAVQDLLGIYFEIVSGLAKPDLIHQAQTREIDMLASLAATDERSQYLTFTRPYISLPVNIFTRDDVAYIASPGDLVGKRVAVVSGYAVEQWLAHDYPGIELVQTATTIEALERLQQQDVFAFVGNLVTTGYYLGLTKAVDIKVVGDTEYDYQQAMGVRSDWPLLASILQKALDAIPTSQQNEIQRSWLSVSYEYGFDYRRLWQVLIAAMIVVGVIAGAFLYWNRRLSREIRGRRNAELDLLHAKELAEDANRAKSKFLANMSHEIRTPMNAVLGYAHLLRNETGMTVEQREYLNSISRSGTHLLGLLDDVLDMSKIEAGRLTINHAPFDLHTLVDDLEMMFRIRAQAKGVRIETSIADGVPQYVRGDEGKVRQILINILGNATKFTDRGMIRLRLWCSPELAHQKEDRPSLPQSCQEDARIICFEVEDTGRGIDKSDLKTIFEAFERPHTENAHAGGTGLGLAISRQYAEAMGGSIAVESEWGEGSRFRFCMPIDEVFFRDSEDSTPCRTSSPLPAVGSEIRLLIVDPKSANREAVIRMLEPLNLSIRETSDNEEALRVFQEWRPHVILMDLSDCTMNQSFAIEEIRKIEREMLASDDDCGHVTIIAVAVNPQDEERLRTTIAGVDAFLAR
ncbi:transporter substrate-binding domain-containing protein, partial [Candidatus Bipolaricaulota bacterium]|nr:transporter substrate-binding domain-containing protein [Candidatus Bipolaricaulota bacterium]